MQIKLLVRIIILFGLFFHSVSISAFTYFLPISQEDAIKIAVKVWYNESGGSISGLTSWNRGENFASMGIGHFIWYPAHRYQAHDSFTELLNYMQRQGVILPAWLEKNKSFACPWQTRSQFVEAHYSPQMMQLRDFLVVTIPWQAKFMVYRLEQALPRIIARVPSEQRNYYLWQIDRLARTPQGMYALIDYVNFKGDGVSGSDVAVNQGWGLLQVLFEMRYAPENYTPLQAFAWAADRVLTRRVENASPFKGEDRWLAGWRNRIRTYVVS